MRRRWPLDLRTLPHARPSTHRCPIPPCRYKEGGPAAEARFEAGACRSAVAESHAPCPRLSDASPTLADRRRRLRGPFVPRLRRHGACIQTSPTHATLTRQKPDRTLACAQTSEPFEVADDNESLQMLTRNSQVRVRVRTFALTLTTLILDLAPTLARNSQIGEFYVMA